MAESTHKAHEYEPPGPMEGQDEETSSNISGECDILLPTVDALTHNSDFDAPLPPFNISDHQPAQTPSFIDPISAMFHLRLNKQFWRENLSIYSYY